MKYSVFLVAAAMIITQSASAQNVFYRANAYDIKTGERIYSENHSEVWQNGKHSYSVVHYKDTAEKTIVKKIIYFSRSRTATTYKMEDLRTGLVEGVSRAGNGFKLYFKKNKNDEMKSAVKTIPAPVVVDGGFDYFVRDNFDTLMAGRTLTGNFTVAHRLDYFPCRILKVKEGTSNGRKTVTFRMEPVNIVIRTLAEPIYITYYTEAKRLFVYQGASNLEGPDGKNYRVRIVFGYSDKLLEPDQG